MKTLEEVIKQKCKFIGNSKKPYELYNLGPYTSPTTYIRLFLTNMTIESDNIITLLEEMVPLFVYIFSCILRSGYDHREMRFKLKFPNSVLTFENYFAFEGFHYTTPISTVREKICSLESCGHYPSFFATFRVELTLKRQVYLLARYNRREPKEDVAININEIKTYKMDECVICLENKTNVLFCSCGHICVCEKSIKIKRLDACPVCKTKNKTLRIIE